MRQRTCGAQSKEAQRRINRPPPFPRLPSTSDRPRPVGTLSSSMSAALWPNPPPLPWLTMPARRPSTYHTPRPEGDDKWIEIEILHRTALRYQPMPLKKSIPFVPYGYPMLDATPVLMVADSMNRAHLGNRPNIQRFSGNIRVGSKEVGIRYQGIGTAQNCSSVLSLHEFLREEQVPTWLVMPVFLGR